MKKWMIPLLAICSLVLLGGCGKKTEAVKTETTTAVTTAETKTAEMTTAETADTATEAGNNTMEERNWDRIPTVMVDGVLYESTGYISSAIGCGNMDGKITSTVEGNEAPTKNDQSNFGTGYEYQRSSEGQIIVVMDAMKVIFRDPKHYFASDMPEEVLNFNAEVLEVRDGSLLVSFISAPDLFMPPVTGQCVVRTNPEIMKEDAAVGDTIRVWFDGLVQEIYPPILPNVYRVVKEEQEPAEHEPSVENNDTAVKLGTITPGCLYILKGGPVISSVALTGNIAGSESFNSKQTGAGGIRDIFELNEWIDVYLTTRATDGVQVFVFKNTDIADEYNYYNYAGELQNLVASVDLSKPENEGDSWGSFYMNPEDAEPGYYDLVFVCDGIPAAVMRVKVYPEGELEGKTDAELYDIMGSIK